MKSANDWVMELFMELIISISDFSFIFYELFWFFEASFGLLCYIIDF